VAGRLWCGYACPQTVYLEFVFRPLETLFEGRPAARRRRDAGPWTADRVTRKLLKWTAYLVVAGFLAHVFVSYFIGAERMWSLVGSAPWANRHLVFALVAVTGLMFFDFAFFREQTCTVACPYGRLQTVLYDPDTLLVGYDERRGEPRGKRGKSADEAGLGDCIDCGRCVVTCPTGIDIRRGLQMECVGCAQCIDACDDVMTRIGRPRGLVRYTSERELEGGTRRLLRPRLALYAVVLLAAFGAFGVLLLTRSPADVEILRGSRDPFRVLPDGQVANQLRARVTNNQPEPQTFTFELLAPAQGALVTSVSPLTVAGDGMEHVDLVVTLPRSAFAKGRAMAEVRVSSDRGLDVVKEKGLLGPYGP
jgi:cytochrome c oxidase accessory protein FixG